MKKRLPFIKLNCNLNCIPTRP
ncbi:xylulose-5-phosphate phosphoketolase domain protein, partial [Chlamydia psittaci 02DC14]